MINTHPILLPVLVLVLWSMVQLMWMAATRLPAIGAAKLGPITGQRTPELAGHIPKEVQWKADNYNHLLEQPTLFYATAIKLALVAMAVNGVMQIL